MRLKAELKRGITVEPVEIDNENGCFFWNGKMSEEVPAAKIQITEKFENVKKFVLKK